MDCLDECWYLRDKTIRDTDKMVCTKSGKHVDPEKIHNCPDFKEIQSCPSCLYHLAEGCESGCSLDGVLYKCKLQEYKVIYQDVRPLNCDYADIPPCPINRWRKG